jgi:hypothetical protein
VPVAARVPVASVHEGHDSVGGRPGIEAAALAMLAVAAVALPLPGLGRSLGATVGGQ